ncbi:MAG: helix-turn-helix domain-containing protein [Chloroflexota bacterium]|nr:helix-turn-helix domain-containing protein [Chloroflexota bacterium]
MYPVGVLMSSLPTNPVSLTPQAQQLLDALREASDWLNRTELAKRVGKTALNKWDVILLAKLVDSGLIETKQTPRHGPIGYEWKYRAVSPAAEDA